MRFWQRLTVVLVFLLAATPLFAQFPLQATPQTPTVPSQLLTPRTTLQTFLDAAEAGDMARARSTMELDSILLPLRESEGSYRAKQLLFVIDRTKPLDLAKVPDRKEGEPYVFHTYLDSGTSRELGQITIARSSDGGWRFTSESVQLVPILFRNLQDAPSRAHLGVDEIDLTDPGQVGRSLAPKSLRKPVAFLEIWQWLAIAILIGASFVVVPIIRLLVQIVVHLRVPYLSENLTEGSEGRLKSSLSALLLAEGWRMALPYADLPDGVQATIVFLLRLMSGAALAWLLTSLFDALVDVVGHVGQGFGRRAEHILIPVVRKFGKTLILLGTVLFVASALDFNLAGVIAGLGIGGLVLALAAKDSVENLFGSLTILFDMPFGIGDWVRIGDIDGAVEQINLRSTRIRTFEDSVITLPNSNLIKASVENLGQRRYRRILTTIGLEYSTPPDRVEAFCAALREMIENHPKMRPDVVRASLFDLGESSLKVQLYCYLITSDYNEELGLRHDVMLEILRIAERLEVKFAFPSRTLYIPKDESPLQEGAR